MRLNETFYEILETLEKRSTCKRLQVAALIVKDERIISMGWNGTRSGAPHCNDIFKDEDPDDPEFRKIHGEWSLKNESHAEMNAIAFAAKQGISTYGSDLFVTISPCVYCSHLIIASGIKRVFYKHEYDRSTDGLDLIKEANIYTEKICQ